MPQWLRRAVPLLLDTLLAVAFTTVALLLGGERPPPGWDRLDLLGYGLTCAINMSTAVRRHAPLTVFTLCCALWLCYTAAGYWPVVNSMGVLLALYSVAAARSTRVALGSTLVTSGAWIVAGLSNPLSNMWTVAAQSVVVPAVMWKFGDSAHRLAERNDQLSVLTERLRIEQEDRARRAVAEERVRIAGELHDVVAHHMSVISVQAGLAHYVFASDPETARTALGTIAGTSGEALEEMRRLLAVLRVRPEGPAAPGSGGEAGAVCPPAPGLDRIEDVVERVRTAGVPVELRVTGGQRPLPPGVELCAYRVVQEALTNVIKHARPASATVLLDFAPDRLTVEVADDGRGPVPANRAPGGGHGLIGMRERARICGGSLTVGPRAGGGFEVHLTLPVRNPAGSGPPGKGTARDDPGACR